MGGLLLFLSGIGWGVMLAAVLSRRAASKQPQETDWRRELGDEIWSHAAWVYRTMKFAPNSSIVSSMTLRRRGVELLVTIKPKAEPEPLELIEG